MGKKELINLIRALGILPLDIRDNWVQVSCPLAETNHVSKQDSNPSAGFSINNNGPSTFHCFVCGTRSIESILNTYRWKKGVDLIGDYVRNEVQADVEVGYREKFQAKKEPIPVPNEILDKFEPIVNAGEYLLKRGIDINIARQHGLLYCRRFVTTQNKIWKNAVLVPIRDTDYKTYWIHFRSVDSKFFWHGKPAHFGLEKEWGKHTTFFGMEHLDITKTIVIVEGAFDVLRLKTLGLKNVIGTHGGISHKSEKLNRLKNLSIISGFDADEPGLNFHKAIERFFGKPIRRLDWSLVGCKDPGELKSKEDLQKVLNTKERNLKFQDKWRNRV